MLDHDTWPEFSVPWDDDSPGPVDLSGLLDKPAGAKGFIRSVDGHLVSGDGERLRLWGLNICTDMPLPPMEFAPTVAGRLAKYGVNCLRLHAIDHRWPNGILMRAMHGSVENRWWGGQHESTRAIDPEALARLDYFIYCCLQRGIYLDLNLNVARRFSQADGVKQAEQVRWGKGLTYFDRQLIALQKEYAAQILDHVNPFTNRRYAEEPAIAIVELVNENSLLDFWVRGLLGEGEPTPEISHWYNIPSSYVAELDRLWNQALTQRYPDRQALSDAWAGDLQDYEDALAGSVRRRRPDEFAHTSARRFQEEARFYAEIEERYFVEMEAFLRGTLGVRQLILGTSDHSQRWSALPMIAANATLDVMDGHFYWQHPRSRRPGVQWSRGDWFILNSPMVDDPDRSVVASCSRTTLQNKPYIVSECNEPFPNDYASEFIPITAAYALLQDWDGIIFYDYDGSWGSPYWQREEWRDEPDVTTFGVGRDPLKWTQMAAGALTFLRGDVRAAERMVARTVTREFALESLRVPADEVGGAYWIPGLRGRLGLVHRTTLADMNAQEVSPQPEDLDLPEDVIVSDTGELTWENTPGDGRVLIDAPRQQAVIGRAGRRATQHLEVELETPFAAITLSSLDERPIATADRLLLSAAARVANTGMRWTDETRQSLGEQWGAPPIRIEPVVATITLRGLGASGALLQPLDGRGQPWGAPQRFVSADGGLHIELTGEPATPWYVIEVQR
jgi:hypothetical protein